MLFSIPFKKPHRCPAGSIAAILAGTLSTTTAAASDLVDAHLVRPDTVLLHFDDGHVVRHKIGEPTRNDILNVTPLATDALDPAMFTLARNDGTDAAMLEVPTSIGRKSKGTEFIDLCEGYDRNRGCVNTSPDHAKEHWVYLTFEKALTPGEQYVLSWDGEALNTSVSEATIDFDPARLRTEALHVNQLGYQTRSGAKFGYLYHWAGDLGGLDFEELEGAPFHLVKAGDGSIVHLGEIGFRAPADQVETAYATDSPAKNFLGAAVWECDFSTFTTPGEYRLVVDRVGCSFPFSIGSDPYREAFAAMLKGLAQNRSGVALDASWADEARPAPHHPTLTPGFSDRLHYSTFPFTRLVGAGGGYDESGHSNKAEIEEAAKGILTESWGWYQDAGDWDAYFSHFDVPTYLLTLFILHPEKFSDGDAPHPEAGNGIPDLLDEAAWLPRHLYRMRHELLEKGWGTGGVGGRVLGDAWGEDRPGGIGRGSWQDTDRDWYVLGEDAFSTFRYAACAALLEISFSTAKKPDPAGIDWAAEASAAWSWAEENKTDYERGLDGQIVAGEPLSSHRALAAAALYRQTGDKAFLPAIEHGFTGVGEGQPIQESARLVTAALYSSSKERADKPLEKRLNDRLVATADLYFKPVRNRGCRWFGNLYQPTIVGASTTPLVTPLVFAQHAVAQASPEKAAAHRNAIQTTADYFLGTNPLNVCWITGTGDRPATGVFHLDDLYLGDTPRVGLIPYGPSRYPFSWVVLNDTADPPFRGHPAYNSVGIAAGWQSAYPDMDSDPSTPFPLLDGPGTWPTHEAWFSQGIAPQPGEFTVHQQHANAIVTYGFLCASAER